jgi:Na+-transporting NADH:ubiquinone oxidoreductase subunit B
MWANREVGHETPWQRLAMGNISGVFETDGGQRILSAGSMGEGCAVIILLAAAYLLLTKTAKWQLMIPGLLGVVVSSVLFRNVLGFGSTFDGDTFVYGVPPLHLTLLSGTTLFAVVFMVTEPVSAPKKPRAQMAYAFLIGFLIVLLRWRGVFVAAASFSILLGNLLGPLLDLAANQLAARKKARAAKEGAT